MHGRPGLSPGADPPPGWRRNPTSTIRPTHPRPPVRSITAPPPVGVAVVHQLPAPSNARRLALEDTVAIQIRRGPPSPANLHGGAPRTPCPRRRSPAPSARHRAPSTHHRVPATSIAGCRSTAPRRKLTLPSGNRQLPLFRPQRHKAPPPCPKARCQPAFQTRPRSPTAAPVHARAGRLRSRPPRPRIADDPREIPSGKASPGPARAPPLSFTSEGVHGPRARSRATSTSPRTRPTGVQPSRLSVNTSAAGPNRSYPTPPT